MKFFNFRKSLSNCRIKVLLYSVAFGLLIMLLFSGKNRVDIETITVSPNEQYIAFFETGRGHRICCFRFDGSLAFDFCVRPDFDAGGNCTLWFENDILCVLFYRTNKIVHFALDGKVLEIVDNTNEECPPKFSSFLRKGNRYIFDGKELDVIYNKRGFLEYWFFGAERYLAIISPNGEIKKVCAWTAME